MGGSPSALKTAYCSEAPSPDLQTFSFWALISASKIRSLPQMDKRGQLGYGSPGPVSHPIGYVTVNCKLPEDGAMSFPYHPAQFLAQSALRMCLLN